MAYAQNNIREVWDTIGKPSLFEFDCDEFGTVMYIPYLAKTILARNAGKYLKELKLQYPIGTYNAALDMYQGTKGLSIDLHITYACNLTCANCNVASHIKHYAKGTNKSMEFILEFIEKYKHYGKGMIVKLLGGDIWLDSEWKRGTTFYFSIPYVESMFATNQSVKKYKGKYDWRGHTIIIAEDVDINYKLLNDILKHTGVDIIRAKDGKECIDLYKVNKKNTSLILMDVQMPVLNGYETIKRIKKMSGYVPIIVQTAYAMNENIKKCYDVGCDDFISKPIVKEKLLNKINDLINKK